MQSATMRFLYLILFVATLVWQSATAATAVEFRLTNGDVYRGEATGLDDDGMVVKLDGGGFSPRISWSRLTQETLKELQKNRQAARFVEPFIEQPPPEPRKERKKKEIVVREVSRPERPVKSGFLASVSTPAGLALLGVFLAANLYAAYHVAVYRNRPVVLVCAISFFLPVLGPILFLSLPTVPEEESELTEGGAEAMDPALAAAAPAAAPGGATTQMRNKMGGVFGGKPAALSIAHGEKAGAAGPAQGEPSIYRRGDVTFNRRFFESKFSGFFPIVQTGPEKDMVLVIKAGRSEYVAKRISRISSTDVHIQALRGAEAQVPFDEIAEVHIRPKDAKG